MLTTFGMAETTGPGDGDGDASASGAEGGSATMTSTSTSTTSDSESATDTAGVCGDGQVDPGEECDLGPDNSAEGQCTPDCLIAACGDGYVYTGEDCDDGNSVQTDDCLNDCTLASCGDGYTHEGVEQCDDGNDVEGDGCSNECQLGSCGDGFLDEGEQCDDANDDNSDDCLDTCQLAFCGDGYVYAGVEFCDGGGETAECDFDCTFAECGDTTVNASANEECDDGNEDPRDECTTECLLPACGDGWLQGEELCDGEEFGEASCSDYEDFNSGDLQCDEQCAIDISLCSQAECPDGGAFVNGYCWYASDVCETAVQKCQSVGLVGQNGYIDTPWSQEVMDEVANQLGLMSGGDAGCCVEFGWIENGSIFTHNFGNQFYNWSNCYSNNPTLKACLAP